MRLSTRTAILGLAIVFLAGVGQAQTANRAYDLAAILSGTFQGSTPGNDLRLDIRSVQTDTEHPFDLFVEVSGKYQGELIRRQGVLRVEQQGQHVYLGYIPHFDATVTALSPNAARFTDQEAGAACGLTVDPRGDGFAGQTSGSSCMFALRGARGKWSIEVEPGSIRLRDVATGETLRFRRVGKS
jgi:hypothetical protein